MGGATGPPLLMGGGDLLSPVGCTLRMRQIPGRHIAVAVAGPPEAGVGPVDLRLGGTGGVQRHPGVPVQLHVVGPRLLIEDSRGGKPQPCRGRAVGWHEAVQSSAAYAKADQSGAPSGSYAPSAGPGAAAPAAASGPGWSGSPPGFDRDRPSPATRRPGPAAPGRSWLPPERQLTAVLMPEQMRTR